MLQIAIFNFKLNLLQINITMTSAIIRQKLYDFIRVAEDEKVKALYTIFENEIEKKEDDYWNDKTFVEELERRSSAYKTGKAKGVAWEDAKAQILNSSKTLAK